MMNSLSIYIRKEKARIRREVLDTQGQREAIQELYKKYKTSAKQNDNTGNIQPSVK
jgi:hypothetical protein